VSHEPRLQRLLESPLPWRPLGELPTPVRRLDALAEDAGLSELWLKDDGASSRLYGGNKVRKLEFLLARCLDHGRDRVMTFGALGSHHSIATAAFGRQLGLEVDLYLYPQPLSHHVLDNLLLDAHFEARMHRIAHISMLPFKASLGALRRGRLTGRQEIIPPGGSDPLGTMGYVEAGLELCAQIEEGALPAPDFVYVAAGTCGTAAGLALGLALGGLPATRVVAVQVVDTVVCNPYSLRMLTRLSLKLLRRHGLRGAAALEPRLDFLKGQLGRGYGHPTDAAADRRDQAARLEGLKLETTYTAKALAGMFQFIEERSCGDARHLFWNTLSSVDHSSTVADVDPASLPTPFHADFRALQRLP
jgi:1-aminocyclopropane-1-carboxylate deaminase/D-cysteine desulfhydrase-like pyridoxal-dependent ACC family enzyme